MVWTFYHFLAVAFHEEKLSSQRYFNFWTRQLAASLTLLPQQHKILIAA